ncbi:MAG TPA: hypothetical protein VLG92_04750 [Candidatus Saccharimonadia bacterium]|nr:hypothetical protein [Candidatus Saccharimonadia bacterium]
MKTLGQYSEYDYEALRVILEEEKKRPVTIEEAKRVGDDLMEFYGALMSGPVTSVQDDEAKSKK